MALHKRQWKILEALTQLDGEATTQEIAEKTGLRLNDVSQGLGALYAYVSHCGGKGSQTRWRLKRELRA